MEKIEILQVLYSLDLTKTPPCLIYKKLVDLTGRRNSWNVRQWINFLNKEV